VLMLTSLDDTVPLVKEDASGFQVAPFECVPQISSASLHEISRALH